MRAELSTPIEQGADAELQFPVESVGLEFQMTMTVEGKTGRGAVLGWWSGYLGQRIPRASTHAVMVSLGVSELHRLTWWR